MKTGKAQVEAVSVFCPECGEAYDFPSGSQTFCAGDPRSTKYGCDSVTSIHGGSVVVCGPCGARFRMPRVVDQIN